MTDPGRRDGPEAGGNPPADRHGEDLEARERFRPGVRQPAKAKGRPGPCLRTLRSAARRAAHRARGASEGEDASGCSSGDCLRGEPCLARFGSLRSASWNAPPLVRPSWATHERKPRPRSDLFPGRRRWSARVEGWTKLKLPHVPSIEAQGGASGSDSNGSRGCHFWLRLPKPAH